MDGFFVLGRGTCLSGVVEDQDAAGAEGDLFGLPGGTYSFATHFRTCLATLMLESYYRIPPASQGGN